MDVFINDLIYILSFKDTVLNIVLLGTVVLGAVSGLVGVFTMLNQKSLLTDAVAHSVLPGICMGFILSGTKNIFYLIPGALVSGFLAVFLVDWIVLKSKIKSDTAIAVVLSTMFALGVLILNGIQNSHNANQAGLSDFLFGKASTMMQNDVYVYLFLSFFVLLFILFTYKSLKVYLFDASFALSIGVSETKIRIILSSFIVLITAIGVQTVGVVLIAALLISPSVSGLLWSNRFNKALLFSAIFGAVAAFVGVVLSYLFPKMPTGPSVVLVLAFLAFISLLFSPKKGILVHNKLQRKNKTTILKDNLLKLIYKLNEKENDFNQWHSIHRLKVQEQFTWKQLSNGLRLLKNKKMLLKSHKGYKLSKKGLVEAQRIVRLHRLWELYLQEYMNLKDDHVHDSAESIEHLIDADLEKELLKILNQPQSDPHHKKIPYQN